MPRDQVIKRAFEIADDGMQGAVGYFHYVQAACRVANPSIVADYLPRRIVDKAGALEIQPVMQMFHEWNRFYDPNDLIKTMGTVFTPYHVRTCTLGIVSIFEAFLSQCNDRLVAKGHTPPVAYGYKSLLRWAFPLVLASTYGTQDMLARRPELCLHIDHARRVRNLWMHSGGNFNRRYKTDAIKVPKAKPIVVPEYSQFGKAPRKKVPFPVDVPFFEMASRSHIEALHHIHDRIQVTFFGQKRAYGYKTARKRLKWDRVMFGV